MSFFVVVVILSAYISFARSGDKTTAEVRAMESVQNTEDTVDCSPTIDYPTQQEEREYCRLQKANPGCEVMEDLTVYCLTN
jgi:hypothetical protein